jgi:hypothetical protein
MASELNISETNIRNFINGSYPKIEFVFTICKKLDINYEWLLTGKVEMLKSDVVEVDKGDIIDYQELYFDAKYKIDVQKKYIYIMEMQIDKKTLCI